MKIYVASSWRNDVQPAVVEELRKLGYEVYDFKNPEPDNHGFHWSEIDPDWKNWTPDQFIEALGHPVAKKGFTSDMRALVGCDTCVLVLPSGRSAHLEAGYAVGAGKRLVIYISEPCETELMYLMTPYLCTSMDALIYYIKHIDTSIGVKA
jgi:nucleoside 2-deoxyribosyltransferase